MNEFDEALAAAQNDRRLYTMASVYSCPKCSYIIDSWGPDGRGERGGLEPPNCPRDGTPMDLVSVQVTKIRRRGADKHA